MEIIYHLFQNYFHNLPVYFRQLFLYEIIEINKSIKF